jgi:hypothetical protein
MLIVFLLPIVNLIQFLSEVVQANIDSLNIFISFSIFQVIDIVVFIIDTHIGRLSLVCQYILDVSDLLAMTGRFILKAI